MSAPQLAIVTVAILVGFVGVTWWVQRPTPNEPPRGDDLQELIQAVERDEHIRNRRFFEAAAACLLFATALGTLAGILSKAAPW